MDTGKIDACISLVSTKGSPADICVLYTRLSDKLHDHVIELEMASRQYLSELLDMIKEGSFPFKFKKSNPRSVLYTATGLNILHETGVIDSKILDSVIACLLSWQDNKGWWKDSTELLEVNNLPFYQDPMDASVRIFNTASVGSILTKFMHQKEVRDSLDKAMIALKTAITSNGALIGFPQSTIFASPLFANYFGIDSDEFQTHLSVLETILNSKPTMSDIVTIGEQLTIAGLKPDHDLIAKCLQLVEEGYIENVEKGILVGGWKTMKQYDPALTMRALIFIIEGK